MNWTMVRLADLGQWFGGGTPSKARSEFWLDGTVPWLSPKDMGPDVLSGTQDRITQAAVEGSAVRMVPAGSVAVVIRSGILERTVPIAVVPFETTLNQDMKALSPRNGVEPSWVAWALRSIEQRILSDARKAGTTVASIEFSRLLVLQIPLPGIEEQRRIVAILEEHVSDLDDGMSSLRKAEARCRLLKRSILLDLIPEPSAWPTHWRSETVSAVGSVELGRQRHPDWHHGSNMRPYLRVANVFEDRIDTSDVMQMHWQEDTFDRFKLRPGQILLNEGQSPQYLGRPAMYRGEPAEVAFTNSLLRFTAGPEVLPEFALIVFRRHMHAGRFARESRITTNIAHLSASRLKTVEFPLPPLADQKDLVDLARERLEAVSRIEGSIQAQTKRASGLRRSVLAAAFSGRLTGHWPDTDVISEFAEEEPA